MNMKNLSTFKIFIFAVAILIISIVINICSCLYYCNSVKELHIQNVTSIEKALKNIEIQNNKNKIFRIKFEKADDETIKRITNDNYLDFLIKYNENQAQWLNIWLTILAIALAFIGLIAPLCFMKLYEDKKSEMDKVILEAEKQKDEAKLRVDEMKKQLNEVNKKSEQMTKDLKSVKEYVNEARALSKYTEAINKIREGKREEAAGLFDEAINLAPNNDQILYAKAVYIYCHEKQYKNAIELLNRAIVINKKPEYYANLAIAYRRDNSPDEFLKNIHIAIDKNTDTKMASYYYSQLAVYYSEIKNINKTECYIKKTMANSVIQVAALSNCVLSYMHIEKYNEAIDIFENSIKNNGNATDFYNITEAYILSGNFTKAINALDTYIRIQNKNICYGIYFDDYEKWTDAISKIEETPETRQLIDKINLLEQRERK